MKIINNILKKNNIFLAPMAGVTDSPFRQLCKSLGAGLVTSEMISSNKILINSKKTQKRICFENETSPISIQIAGHCPKSMSEIAKYLCDIGADIIDINMGCPKKKVCNKFCGSSLLKNEKIVSQIITSVVNSVNLPITLKIRTGWDEKSKNALNISKIAEESGIKMLAIHGRTRSDFFNGKAEFDTIANVKSRLTIPVIANGDIDNPFKARKVLSYTKADGIMIGRAALGNPWIFREVKSLINENTEINPPDYLEIKETMILHLKKLIKFYGEYQGVRIARKHINWYLKSIPNSPFFLKSFNSVELAQNQIKMIDLFFKNFFEKTFDFKIS